MVRKHNVWFGLGSNSISQTKLSCRKNIYNSLKYMYQDVSLSYVTPVTPASACVQIFLFLNYFCYKLKQNIFHVNSSDFQYRITVQDPISSLGVNTATTISVRLHNNGRKYPVLSRNYILLFTFYNSVLNIISSCLWS